MNHGWEYKSFTHIADTLTPVTKIEKSEYLHNGLYPIVSQEDALVSGYWNDIKDITPHTAPIIIFGDHSRVLKYVDFDFVVGADGVKIISPKKGISAKYLFHYLKWYKVPSLGYSRHFKLIKDARYLIPPTDKQEQIAGELDKINELIELKRRQLADLDLLGQSLFYEMFGEPFINPMDWDIKSFGELSEYINYGTSLPSTEGGQYPYLRMNNLTDNGYLDLSNLKYIDIPEDDIDKYLVKYGDILFNRTNSREKVGKTALYDREDMMVIAGYIIRVRANHNLLNPVFAVRYMNMPELKEYLRKICRGAVNQANINSKEMSAIPFLAPPIDLQNKFAENIKIIEEQKKLIESSITDLQSLLASRMDYWFNDN